MQVIHSTVPRDTITLILQVRKLNLSLSRITQEGRGRARFKPRVPWLQSPCPSQSLGPVETSTHQPPSLHRSAPGQPERPGREVTADLLAMRPCGQVAGLPSEEDSTSETPSRLQEHRLCLTPHPTLPAAVYLKPRKFWLSQQGYGLQCKTVLQAAFSPLRGSHRDYSTNTIISVNCIPPVNEQPTLLWKHCLCERHAEFELGVQGQFAPSIGAVKIRLSHPTRQTHPGILAGKGPGRRAAPGVKASSGSAGGVGRRSACRSGGKVQR